MFPAASTAIVRAVYKKTTHLRPEMRDSPTYKWIQAFLRMGYSLFGPSACPFARPVSHVFPCIVNVSSQVTPKPTRSLRGTRRVVSEDSADELPRSSAGNGVAARKAKDTPAVASKAKDTPAVASKTRDTPAVASQAVDGKVRSAAVARRTLKRDRIQCPHVQV